MAKNISESLNRLYRILLIWIIRTYPILFSIALLFHQCEVIHSINEGNIIEYYNGDILEYIQYDTPFSDKYLSLFFNNTLFNSFLFLILSKVFLFCIYHRVFIFEMFAYSIIDIILKNMVFEDTYFYNIIYYTSIGFISVCFLIALYLHQRYGDRYNICKYQSISEGYRNCCNT